MVETSKVKSAADVTAASVVAAKNTSNNTSVEDVSDNISVEHKVRITYI